MTIDDVPARIDVPRLMTAVLWDAVFLACKTSQSPASRTARQWIACDRARYIFDFRVICEVLDIDPGCLRVRVSAGGCITARHIHVAARRMHIGPGPDESEVAA